MYDIGKRIKELRKEKGMTLEELGNKVGAGKSTVRKWEEGIVENMKRDKIIAVANALGCTPEYLMGYTKDEISTKYQVLLNFVSSLNADGIAKLIDYAEELSEHPKYRKD